MLSKWNIKKEQVHLIVRGNASNMVKAMADGDFENVGCFAHTLQLVLCDGIFSQRAIVNTLVVCLQIVGHFKHSPLAYDHLKTIQERLQLTKHWLKQNVSTRWNSTLYIYASSNIGAKDGFSNLYNRVWRCSTIHNCSTGPCWKSY